MGIIQITWKAIVASALLAGSMVPAYTRSLDATPGKAHQTAWELSSTTWFRLVPREKGAKPNDHPVKLDAAVLIKALGAIRITTPEREEALFESEELGYLAKTMANALSLADPGEDLLLFSGNKRGHGMFSANLAVVARLFVKDGALNILLHDSRMEVLTYRASRAQMWALPTASRTQATQEVMKCPGAFAVRPDWLVLALDLPAPEVVAAPAPVLPKPQEPAPSLAESERRLKLLKQLREENILTEEEYQSKRREVLKTL